MRDGDARWDMGIRPQPTCVSRYTIALLQVCRILHRRCTKHATIT
jgi:hypothetical protein